MAQLAYRVVLEVSLLFSRSKPHTPIKLSWSVEGWRARLLGRDSEVARTFEEELLADGRVELSLFQRREFVAASSGEHLLFQLRAPSGKPAMQAVVTLERPRRLPQLARGRGHQLGWSVDAEAELRGLQSLRELCRASGAMVSLRLQPHRTEGDALCDVEARARRAGFQRVEPLGVTRTLLLDLAPGVDRLLASLSKKTRWRVRHRSREQVELRALTDRRFIPACVTAANASLSRTGGGTSRFDFAAAFHLAASAPERVRITGVFLRNRPDTLLAFNIGMRHDSRAEYSSAGSLLDPALRELPFNYWLLWELILWAQRAGARCFDFGGITDGSEEDRCRGISAFKRHFCDREVEVGRELISNLKPAQAMALDLWSAIRRLRSM